MTPLLSPFTIASVLAIAAPAFAQVPAQVSGRDVWDLPRGVVTVKPTPQPGVVEVSVRSGNGLVCRVQLDDVGLPKSASSCHDRHSAVAERGLGGPDLAFSCAPARGEQLCLASYHIGDTAHMLELVWPGRAGWDVFANLPSNYRLSAISAPGGGEVVVIGDGPPSVEETGASDNAAFHIGPDGKWTAHLFSGARRHGETMGALWGGGGRTCASMTNSHSGNGGVVCSADRGRTWSSGGAVPELSIGTGWISETGTMYAPGYEQISMSTDRGATWKGHRMSHRVLAMTGIKTDEIYAIDETGVLQSDGKQWTTVHARPSLARIATAGTDVYAFGDSGLVRSGDHGKTWSDVGSSIQDRPLEMWASGPNDVYVIGERVYHSTDRGKTWNHEWVPGGRVVGIAGASATEVYVLMADGTILRRRKP